MSDERGQGVSGFAPVSVVIPFYRGHATIGRTLASLAGQTLRPAEVLVVDDGSPEPLETAPASGVPVRVLRHERNRGIPAARNTGIRAARQPWVAFLDHDDEWAPRKLERQWDLVREAGEPDDLVVFGRLLMESAGRPPHLRPPARAMGAVEAGGGRAVRAFLRYGNVVPFVTVLMHRALLERHGYLDETLVGADDTELVLRLLGAGVRFRGVDGEGDWSAAHHYTGGNFSDHAPRWVGDQLRFIPALARRYPVIRPYRDSFLARAEYTLGRHHERLGEPARASMHYRRASRLDAAWWRPWVARAALRAPASLHRVLEAAWNRLERAGEESPE